MPKRRCSELDGGRTAGRTQSHHRQQHLYLVFDDWKFGYSIREVNLLSDAGEGADQRLPRAFLRWAAPRRFPQYFTSAFGSRIMLMHPRDSGAVPIVDVRKRSVIFGPESDYPSNPIYFPIADDKLFALDVNSFEVCRWRLEQPDEDGLLPEQPQEGYSLLDDPVGDKWSWCQLPAPPFNTLDVTSYAVHFDGETILVSTESDASVATFTFHTDKLVWKQLGDWKLPFNGRGHFVCYLEAFVGLSKDSETLGYLYCCKVPSTDTGERQCPAPAWRLSKEKVFSKNTAERHVGATLVYTGHQAKFCLVECVSVEEDRADQLKKREDVSQCSRYMYRLITFSLRFDMMGDLRVKHCRVRCYKVPNKASTEFLHEADPVAFWL